MRVTEKAVQEFTESQLAEYLGDWESDILVGLCVKFPEDRKGPVEVFLKKTIERANERGCVWYTKAGEAAAIRYLALWRDRLNQSVDESPIVSEDIQATNEKATGEVRSNPAAIPDSPSSGGSNPVQSEPAAPVVPSGDTPL